MWQLQPQNYGYNSKEAQKKEPGAQGGTEVTFLTKLVGIGS